MANNYAQGTLNEVVHLTDKLVMALVGTGARVESNGVPGSQEETSYVVWDESFQEDVDMRVEMADDDDVSVLDHLPIEQLFRSIFAVKGNEDIKFFVVEFAYTCDKMRLGEFGGSGLYVTRDQYLWIGSHSADIEDGKLKVAAHVHDFEEEFDIFKIRLLQEDVI